MADALSATRARCLDDVVSMLESGGRDGAGDERALTALDHALQCAAALAAEYPEDRELQVAGLLHDIGHRLAPGQPERHGVVAGDYLRDLFGVRIADLVEMHVDAKRYLVAVEPSYRDLLSEESARTLIAQGEALPTEEVHAFAARRHAADAVRLRRADEAAKVPGRSVPPLTTWVPVLERVVAR